MSTETDKARVLIVDRHPLICSALSALINEQTDMCTVGESNQACEVLEQVAAHQPNIVVLEIALKGESGMELIQQIRHASSASRVLALSMYDESVYAPRVLRAGGGGFISKDEEPTKVVDAIRRVVRGETVGKATAPAVSETGDGKGEQRDIQSLLAKLTDRELEVFEFFGHGLSVQQIAKRMSVAANTIESYRERIKKKLQIKSGTELTVRAAQWVMNT